MIEEKLYVATIGYSTQIIQTPSKFIDIDWIKQNLFKHPDDTYIEVVRNCFFESKCLIIIDESSRIRDKPKTVCTPRRGTMCGNVMICGEDIDNHLERDLCGIPLRELEVAVKQCIQILQPNRLLMGKKLWQSMELSD